MTDRVDRGEKAGILQAGRVARRSPAGVLILLLALVSVAVFGMACGQGDDPTATPAPTVAPTAPPEPTAAPTAPPEPTAAPTSTPEPTSTPTSTPEPTSTPTATPEPTSASKTVGR